MPRIAYRRKRIGRDRLEMIAHANQILDEYRQMGYCLTLRQVYYVLVSQAVIPNTVRSYKRLGDLVDDGRMCGLLDWDMIEDRTRNMQRRSRWPHARSLLSDAAAGFHIDRWRNQDVRAEVWVEKEALVGIFAQVCEALDVPYFACRGYVSQSEMWRAAQRIKGYIVEGKDPIILHFGDHDPSGIDMTRDIADRLRVFGVSVQVQRMALNMDQVDMYAPPPNPAKITDSRFGGYAQRFGDESWELDALRPDVLNSLVIDRINELRDADRWRETVEREIDIRADLETVREEWEEIADHILTTHDETRVHQVQSLKASYENELKALDGIV